MRALVTGSSGQVATALAQRAGDVPGLGLRFLARPQFDLEAPEALAREIVRQAPDVVLSVAAYTAVDQAEEEAEQAMAINGHAPGVLAAAAHELQIPIVHLSTDYVFSGTSAQAYVETDPTGPVTEYGRSKLEGERAVAKANPRHVILRTAWVYSAQGKNFAKTMLSLAQSRDQLTVVDDQFGNPTSALDIADGILRVVDALAAAPSDEELFGTYHMVGSTEASWYDFANEIFRQSAMLNGPSAEVAAVDSSGFPTKAKRPANSRLNTGKFASAFGHTLPGYHEALPVVLAELLTAD